MALIFDIKRFSINDGPGIRTTIFMKGCPLRCRWCHNPEGLQSDAQMLFTKKKCIGCGTCKGLSPEEAARECPTLARQVSGKEWNMDELMAVIEKERKVMEDSRGGVTVSGGEPMMHPDYLLELLTELGRRHFHRSVDTTLFTDSAWVEKIAACCELFLIDLKHMDSAKHKEFTGVPNEKILSNISLVAEMEHPYWIRIPLINGVNADEKNIVASAQFLAGLKTKPEVVNLLPYHNIGMGKLEKLTSNPVGLNAEEFSAPAEELQEQYVEMFRKHGLNTIIGG